MDPDNETPAQMSKLSKLSKLLMLSDIPKQQHSTVQFPLSHKKNAMIFNFLSTSITTVISTLQVNNCMILSGFLEDHFTI